MNETKYGLLIVDENGATNNYLYQGSWVQVWRSLVLNEDSEPIAGVDVKIIGNIPMTQDEYIEADVLLKQLNL